MLSEEMREYLFRLSETQPVTQPEAGWPDAVALLEQRIEALKPYLIHGRDCRYDKGDEDWDAIPCNCGLVEAVAHQEEARQEND